MSTAGGGARGARKRSIRTALLLLAVVSPVWAYQPTHGSEVLWDTYGVPHVFARTVPDLFYGFGWALARSHGDLLARLYAEAEGRAAEFYGPSELANDRWMFINDVPARARRWLREQPPAFRRDLEAFAAGIDAYAAEHPDALTPQARRVFPVSAADVIAYSQHLFQFTYAAPERRAEHLPPFAEGVHPGGAGSNGWAIAPSRSASGHAMLLMNPHLPWAAGWSTYYEAQLSAPGIDLYGATQVGLPVLRFVFSDYLGFTHTVNAPNAVTFYRITPAPGGYRFNGRTLKYRVRTGVLKVLQPDGSLRSVSVTVRSTIQGPVIGHKDGAPIAMRVAGLDRPRALQQYWRMATAHNFAGFQAALREMQVPTFNIIYADRDGNIEYLYNGLVPRHRFGDLHYWTGIVPGDTSKTLWTSYMSYEQLPKVIDPPGGTVQNSNNPPWDTAWPSILNPAPYADWVSRHDFVSLRMERAIRMLSQTRKISFAQLLRDKWSTRSELADRILPELIAAANRYGDALARQAAQVLAHWDRTANADSRGALLFLAWVDQPGAVNGYSGKGFAHPFELQHPLTTPSGLAHPRAAVRALDAAARHMLQAYGSLDKPWGEVMRLKLGSVNLPASGGPGKLGIFNVIQYGPPMHGERAAVFGASYMAVVRFSNPIKARVLLTYGDSTQPGSPHRSDQLSLLSNGKLRTAWRTRAEVLAHLARRDVF